jgi:hypothetical protein
MTRGTRRQLPEQPPDPADRVHFVLDEEPWQAFVKLLNRPARAVPGLAEFLARPSVLDEPDAAVDEPELSDG